MNRLGDNQDRTHKQNVSHIEELTKLWQTGIKIAEVTEDQCRCGDHQKHTHNGCAAPKQKANFGVQPTQKRFRVDSWKAKRHGAHQQLGRLLF